MVGVRFQFGHAFAPGARAHCFATAPLYMPPTPPTGSTGLRSGFNAMSATQIVTWPRGRPRPVHYNCWEAVYFDHKLR
jgi:alpha-galactosidase